MAPGRGPPQQSYLKQAVPSEAITDNNSWSNKIKEFKRIRKSQASIAPRVANHRQNQAPGPQPSRNNNRGHNREEVADSIVDSRDIINARHRSQLVDNSNHFQALSRVFDNVEYPKDFKPTNIQKYDGKTVLNGYVYTRPLLVLQEETLTPRSSTSRLPWNPRPSRGSRAWHASPYTHGMISRRPSSTTFKGCYIE